MLEFEEKIVLHIPLSKYKNNQLVELDIEEALDELIRDLNVKSFYKTNVESHYHNRSYPELLITIFANDSAEITEVFKKWIFKNSDLLEQESYAIEVNNKLIIFDDRGI